MAKIRVHELAKQLEKDSKDIIAILEKNGVEVKNHMSSISDEAAEMVKNSILGTKKPEVKKETAKKEAEKKTDAKADKKPEGEKSGKAGNAKNDKKNENVKAEKKTDGSKKESKQDKKPEAPKKEQKNRNVRTTDRILRIKIMVRTITKIITRTERTTIRMVKTRTAIRRSRDREISHRYLTHKTVH